MKDALHELIINGVHAVFNFAPGTTLFDQQCRRTAQNLIALLQEREIWPVQFWDVGANESQVAKWLVKQWPFMVVHSFEPCPWFKPIGKVYPIALSDADEGTVMLAASNANGPACPYITKAGDAGLVDCVARAVRFDSLQLPVYGPAVLKVDAENYTLKALRGFGAQLSCFNVVVAEIVNHMPDQPQMLDQGREATEIFALLAQHGFHHSRVLDTGWFHQRRVAHYDVAFWR